MDARRREYWLSQLNVEGWVAQKVAEAREDTEPGDDIFIAEIEYELED